MKMKCNQSISHGSVVNIHIVVIISVENIELAPNCIYTEKWGEGGKRASKRVKSSFLVVISRKYLKLKSLEYCRHML